MKFDEARELGEVLGRTAAIREKAPSPENTVVAQGARGALKLVAGTFDRTVIASVGPHEGEQVIVSLPARGVLQMLKTLKGKGEVTFTVTPAGLEAKTDTGGSLTIGADHVEQPPRFMRPVKDDASAPTIYIPDGVLERMAAVIGIMTLPVPLALEYVEWDARDGKEGMFRATDNLFAAEFGPIGGLTSGYRHMTKTYITAMRGIPGKGTMRFLPGPAQQVSRIQTTIGRYLFVGIDAKGAARFPKFPKPVPDVSLRANKSKLVGTLRSIGSGSPMVTLKSDGEKAVLLSDIGSETVIPGELDGVGVVRFNPSALIKALGVLRGTDVTVMYTAGTASPIRVVGEDAGWPILLAPGTPKR